MASGNIQIYFDQWLATATGGKVTAHFAFLQNRVQLKCNVCEMMLTAPRPATAADIDYSIQEFVKIHSHTGGHCAHSWAEVDKTTGAVRCMKCQMFLHGDAPPPTPVTLDFKKIQTTTSGPIDDNPASAAIIQKQMDEYNKTMEVKSLELELKVKKIQLESAKQALGLAQSGVLSLANKGLISNPQQLALTASLLEQQEKLQAEILEEEKAKEQALENVLKIKMLQDKLSKTKMEFHDTGHVAPVAPVLKTKPPLKIATGRKFR